MRFDDRFGRALKWIVGAVILAAAAVQAPKAYRLIRGANEAVGTLKEALPRTEHTASSIVHATAMALQRVSKLVVLSAVIAAEVEERDEKVFKAFGVTLPLGTTTVRMRGGTNKVQFIIPVATLSTNAIAVDSRSQELIVVLPQPRPDPDMVEIDPNPEEMTSIGWARLEARSGEHLRRLARVKLRDAVLTNASSDLYLTAARENARTTVEGLVSPILVGAGSPLRLRVEFGGSAYTVPRRIGYQGPPLEQ